MQRRNNPYGQAQTARQDFILPGGFACNMANSKGMLWQHDTAANSMSIWFDLDFIIEYSR